MVTEICDFIARTGRRFSNQMKRAVIKYLHLKGMSPQEIHDDMNGTLGDDCPSYATIKNWAAEFKRGRTSTKDEPRSGRPREVTNDSQIDHIHNMILNDRRITLRYISHAVGISFGSVQFILSNILRMSKLSARWVPRMLTIDQKRSRLNISEELLARFNKSPDHFMQRIVTQDETWVHHFDPESKEQSKQWKHQGSPPPKKFRHSTSVGKVMASVFWDCKGVIMVNYLQRGHTITGEYYSNELRQLKDAIKKKHRGTLIFLITPRK